MQITKTVNTNADRQARFRARHGDDYRANNATRMRKYRADYIPEFVGVDSEGIGRGENHRAILLGCGQDHYIAQDRRKGLHWKEAFEFLYGCFQRNPQAVYVGFYLRYDFNEWLKTLPEKAAISLFTQVGKERRKVKAGPRSMYKRGQYYPVRCDGWEMDILAFKMLAIRPRVCECLEREMKCIHEQLPWMYICDAGPFFQTSFLKVLENWPKNDRLWTDKEYQTVKYGKENLRTVTRFSKKMIEYNRLENDLLARVMVRQAEGLRDMGLKLSRDKWYGPGPVASLWLQQNGGVKHRDLVEIPEMERWLDVCRQSYYGGWFEIFSHGLVPGISHNYDINSAYPYATTKLPHICDQCHVRTGTGNYKGHGEYVLLFCTVPTRGHRIGAMPYRDTHGTIYRPNVTKGWYWKHELDAATRANLVTKGVKIHEWMEFVPCGDPNPFTRVGALYDQRNVVGKDTPHGKAIKLVINSIYGKFAQSVGGAPFNNWFYASYITSHCRTQILDAIATHPGKAESVLMVATDGICFDSPHPTLPTVGKKLGEWDHTTYEDLCLFKPGVYWDKQGKADLKVKSRGVPAAEFSKGIEQIEQMFQWCLDHKTSPGPMLWLYVFENMTTPDGDSSACEYFLGHRDRHWPQYVVKLSFHMTSCKQALQRGKWHIAGQMQEDNLNAQSSWPNDKRWHADFNRNKGRIDSRIRKHPDGASIESVPYKDKSIKYPKTKDLGYGIDGNAIDDILEAVSIARDKKPNYDIEIDDIEWTTVWDGGPVNGL